MTDIRKIVSAVLVLVIMLGMMSISGCSKIDEGWVPAGMKLATTDAVDYKLYVPESWTVDISTGVVCAYASDSDRSNITMAAMNLSNDAAAMTLDEYWAKYEADLVATSSALSHVDFVSENSEAENAADAEAAALAGNDSEETEKLTYSQSNDRMGNPVSTVLGGTAAQKYYYTATVTGTAVEYMQVIAIRGGIAYIFTYTAVPTNFDTHIENVEKMLENFSFID